MNKLKLTALFVAVLLMNTSFSQSKTVFVKATTAGEDATSTVIEALKKCKTTKATKLVFEKGTYNFLPDLASERYMSVSNNDEGLKRFLFDLSGMKNLEIDGQGSAFILDGYVCPFLMNKSTGITVKNLSIDYKRTFHSEGLIVASYQDSIDVSFSAAYPYFVENNKLMFTGEKFVTKDNAGRPKKEYYPFWHLLEFDAAKREPMPGLEYLPVQNMVVKELKPGLVRLFYPRLTGTVGNTMVFNAENREVSAFTISDSENTELHNVTIYHAGGMGIIGQRSTNILLDSVRVIAAPGRMGSVIADATHYVNCGGKLTMQHCVFESMMDDATNIHGIYVKITKIISPTEVLVKLIHYMQFGFDFLKPKTSIELVEAQSLNTYMDCFVKKSERINKEYTKITLSKPLTDKVKVGDVIASTQQYPEVLISDCKMQKNRGRSFLLGSRGKTVIENNYFHSHCAAITFEGDGRFWFEQAGVRDVTIRNNMFDNCNYSFMFGVGVIMTGSGIEENKKAESRYNRNILIENNTFRMFAPCVLNMYSVDNLVYRNNKIEQSSDYKISEGLNTWFKSINLGRFKISDSSNVKIEE